MNIKTDYFHTPINSLLINWLDTTLTTNTKNWIKNKLYHKFGELKRITKNGETLIFLKVFICPLCNNRASRSKYDYEW